MSREDVWQCAWWWDVSVLFCVVQDVLPSCLVAVVSLPAVVGAVVDLPAVVGAVVGLPADVGAVEDLAVAAGNVLQQQQ